MDSRKRAGDSKARLVSSGQEIGAYPNGSHGFCLQAPCSQQADGSNTGWALLRVTLGFPVQPWGEQMTMFC